MRFPLRITLVLVLLCCPLLASDYVPNRLIVKWKSGTIAPLNQAPARTSASASPQSVAEAFAHCTITSQQSICYGADPFHPESDTEIVLLTVTHTSDMKKLAEQIEKVPDVEWAEPDYLYEIPESLPPGPISNISAISINDPLSTNQGHLSLHEFFDAWEISTANDDIIIAIVDTGIESTHPDLSNKIWVNPSETLNGIDDDGNGLIDDINGWNFSESTANVTDTNGHGTHVSGIAAADTNNSFGVAGTGFNAKVMALKVNIGSSRFVSLTSVGNGILYAIDKGADVINMSLGGSFNSSFVAEAVKRASAANVVLVAAAGNNAKNLDTSPVFPASYDDVIAVSAADESGEFDASYSNFGTAVDIMARGTSVYSTFITSVTPFGSLTGTSMATPIVSGTAALMRGIEADISTLDIRNFLLQTATDAGPSGKDIYTGYGRLNSNLALSALQNDINAPLIQTNKITGEYISQTDTLIFTFIDGNMINETSIEIEIDGSTFTTADDGVSLSTNTLTVNLGQLEGVTIGRSFSVSITVEDIDGNSRSDTFTFSNDARLILTGPRGSGNIINAPNPFNPDNEVTIIGFQVSKTADIDCNIYSLNLQKVFTHKRRVSTGYNTISWDGRDRSGNIVPNGSYILTITARAGSSSITKRNKIAVIR